MTREEIAKATEAYLNRGGEIKELPSLDFIADPNTVARTLIENSVVNSERTEHTAEGRGYEEFHVAHENWLTF